MVAAARAADDGGMTSRVLGHALLGAVAGGWIGRALFKWILDFEGTLLIALIVACAAVGLVIGIASERESR